ncbi:sugar ABC transporter ATP-binding protein [Amycolatopsis pigmentata]|uniref:Sugar ABC transporter ATP-binding protein n=1 Tax=Amycolatopsis pigmentata TaxID=450801 RepID=A0ABW5FN19_9PSEU
MRTPAEIALRCEGVSKTYDGTPAVRPLDLAIRHGTVHALVGANGAGKSTLLGMMSGRIRPTSGRIEVFGTELTGGRPRDAHAAGIACVYQELSLVPHLDACANVFLGVEPAKRGMLSERAMTRRYAELCETLRVDIPAKARASELSVAAGQLVEIMRAIHRGSRVLLLDEPTAALSQRERDQFLALVGRLRDSGTSIVLVTHNLDEVLAVSDMVTVMRNATLVETATADAHTKADLVKLMVGEMPSFVEQDKKRPDGEVLLRIEDCSVPGAVTDVSLEVHANEVVGIAGLVGAGRSSLLRAIAGAEATATGRMSVARRRIAWPRTPRRAHSSGISLLPEDRKTQGLILGMDIPDNVTLPGLKRFSPYGMVKRRAQWVVAGTLMKSFNLNRPIGRYPVGHLSGGGQQKVAFARAMINDPRVMVIDEPTRGVDVGAKVDLLRAIRDFADRGRGVIVTSAEIEELLEICDRIIVMSAGRTVGHFDLHQKRPTVGEILAVAFGVTP